MKHRLLGTLGVIILAIVVFGTIPAEAQTTAPGPYYATPSWDQKLQCDTLATCPRFIVLSNWGSAAVLDRETGLVWERSPGDTDGDGDVDGIDPVNWYMAQYHCNSLPLGDRRGWRLPTFQELASLVDTTKSYPTLPSGHPFQNVKSDGYWSATSASDTSWAWFVSFRGGSFDSGLGSSTKTSRWWVWCVRGGQVVDPQ